MDAALGEEPSVFADLDTVEEYHARFDIIEDVAKTMKSMMCREIRIKVHFTVIPAQMIDEISSMFFEDTEWNKHQTMMEMFQLRMEEGTDLEDHLDKVTSVVDCLCNQLNCFVEYDTLVYSVLATLAPNYRRDVDRLIRAGVNNINLCQLKGKIREMVPEIQEPDVIDG
ncbi:hypothetical protein QYE76_026908 [Lolium multiflorum]|uniref:Uncharacterized protein n=1 Tax=Lolium multiflorum TaxID=4521 RepID=A0AAD8RIL9_LOLMU|nr:hypothetical protein QYE76_026908 [Lolium multiflorum]